MKPTSKTCKVCNKEFKPYTSLDKYCSPSCAREKAKEGRTRRWSNEAIQNRTGKNNPAYKHGKRALGVKRESKGDKLYRKNAESYRQQMLSNHGYLYCERCGITNTRFETHHIIYRSEKPNHAYLHDHANLIRVCVPCHNHYHKSKANRTELVNSRGLSELFDDSLIRAHTP